MRAADARASGPSGGPPSGGVPSGGAPSGGAPPGGVRSDERRVVGPPPGGVRSDERRVVASPVACRRCGITVLVAKFSAAHTSVQWPADGSLSCAEFGDRVSSLVEACVTLRACIDDAVDAGAVEVTPP
jgi:hypothetical protein